MKIAEGKVNMGLKEDPYGIIIMQDNLDSISEAIHEMLTDKTNHASIGKDWLNEANNFLMRVVTDRDPMIKVLMLGSAALNLDKCIKCCESGKYTKYIVTLNIIQTKITNCICLYSDEIRFAAYEFNARIIFKDLTKILFELSKADRCESRSMCIQGISELMHRIANSFTITNKADLKNEIRHIISDAKCIHGYFKSDASKICDCNRVPELDRKLFSIYYRLIKGFHIIDSTKADGRVRFDIGLKMSDTEEKRESTTMNIRCISPKEDLMGEIDHRLHKTVKAIHNMPGRPDFTNALVNIIEAQRKAEAGDLEKACTAINSALDGIICYTYNQHNVGNLTTILCELACTHYSIREYLKSNGGDK